MSTSESSPYFLRSARLGFRFWTENDLPLALGLWGDPEVTRLIDARGQWTADQVRERLLQEIAIADSHGIQYWPIFHLDSAEHIGCCGLRPYEAPKASGRILEIGTHISSAHWGCGYASEAARTVIAHAFGELGADSLFAGHNPNNQASSRLLTKLGFQYTHDEFYPPTGLDHPSYLLRADQKPR